MAPISICVCAIGRLNLNNVQKLVEGHFTMANGYAGNAIILYGDSVTGDTPILVHDPDSGYIYYMTIDSLHQSDQEWTHYHGDKLTNSPFIPNLEVWTERGWTRINRIIKHKNGKMISRVVTHHGCVDVTSDHSLLDKNANKITPRELKVGQSELLHSSFPSVTVNEIVSAGAVHGIAEALAKRELDALPCWVINAPIDSLTGFFDVYLKHDGDYQHNKLVLAQLFFLARRIGLPSSPPLQGNNDTVEKIIPLGILDQDVYDLETENHHFAAGIGEMIVHNTDSVMILWNIPLNDPEDEKEVAEALLLASKYATEAQDLCNNTLFKHLPPIWLDFEKNFVNFLLMAKKNYAAMQWPPWFYPGGKIIDKATGKVVGDMKGKVTSKGLENQRRDKIPFTQIVIDNVLNKAMKYAKAMQLCEYVRAENEKLCKDQYSLWYTNQSKQIKVSYDMECIQTERQKQQIERGLPPFVSGDRVGFNVKKGSGGKNAKLMEQVDDPMYMLENNITPDYKTIGESYIMNAEERILKLFILREFCPDFVPEYFDPKDKKLGKKPKPLPERCVEILNWVWEPFYNNYPPPDAIQKTGLMSIVQSQCNCLVCGIPLDESTAISGARQAIQFFCDKHADRVEAIYEEYVAKVARWEEERKITWDNCYKCVGPRGNAEGCKNENCEKRWYRGKIDAELTGCMTKLKAIQITDW